MADLLRADGRLVATDGGQVADTDADAGIEATQPTGEPSDAEYCAKYIVPVSECVLADGEECPHDTLNRRGEGYGVTTRFMVAEPDAGDTATDRREPTDQQQWLAGLDAVPPGAQVDRSTDGAITSVVTDEDGWSLHVDPDSDLGAEFRRMADRRDEEPEQYLRDAIGAFLRGDLDPSTADTDH